VYVFKSIYAPFLSLDLMAQRERGRATGCILCVIIYVTLVQCTLNR